MKKNQTVFLGVVSLVGMSILNTGCGAQAFNVMPSQANIAAPGGAVVPPKVDILLVEDDTGSITPAFPTITSAVKDFLNQLDQQPWDYHFATIPLTTYRPIQQVVGSKYDSNRGSTWTPAYPGQKPNDLDMLPESFFSLPKDFSGFLTPDNVSSIQNGMEPGFQTMIQTLNNGLGSSNFLRKDSLPVILMIGNGNDTSGVNFSEVNENTVPCGIASGCTDTRQSSLEQYRNSFIAVRPNIKFYAGVANQVAHCLGGSAKVGTRYQWMAKALGGESYDICTQSVKQVLSSLSGSLTSVRLNFETHYMFISQAPNPNSIQVTRYANGQAVSIAQDPINGWTYAGHVSNVAAIDFPTPMSFSTGYAIELHGSAKLRGTDTASVNYTPAGAQNSVTE